MRFSTEKYVDKTLYIVYNGSTVYMTDGSADLTAKKCKWYYADRLGDQF